MMNKLNLAFVRSKQLMYNLTLYNHDYYYVNKNHVKRVTYKTWK